MVTGEHGQDLLLVAPLAEQAHKLDLAFATVDNQEIQACPLPNFMHHFYSKRQIILSAIILVGCEGTGTESNQCSYSDGSYLAWSGWTYCSATCGSGMRSRKQVNINKLLNESQTKTKR